MLERCNGKLEISIQESPRFRKTVMYTSIPVEKRKAVTNKIIEDFPKSRPLIVYPLTARDPKIEKNKYVVPINICMSEFICKVKKYINTRDSLFFFINKKMIDCVSTVGEIYNKYKSEEDGFLYITYTRENAFGITNV